MIERTIAAAVHGRYLVAQPAVGGPVPLLVGFHGYAEAAEIQLERLRSIPAAGRWLVVSVQGLHTFYRGRSQDVVASWMTRQHRELAIVDTLAYVSSVVDALEREQALTPVRVFAGFSQGVATAFRAAVASRRPTAGVVSLGGDVPPEIDTPALARTGAVLVGRGGRDEWYTAEKFASDKRRLRDARVDLRAIELEGGHEWTAEFASAASSFLDTVSPR